MQGATARSALEEQTRELLRLQNGGADVQQSVFNSV
jgi:hypothetical protein